MDTGSASLTTTFTISHQLLDVVSDNAMLLAAMVYLINSHVSTGADMVGGMDCHSTHISSSLLEMLKVAVKIA